MESDFSIFKYWNKDDMCASAYLLSSNTETCFYHLGVNYTCRFNYCVHRARCRSESWTDRGSPSPGTPSQPTVLCCSLRRCTNSLRRHYRPPYPLAQKQTLARRRITVVGAAAASPTRAHSTETSLFFFSFLLDGPLAVPLDFVRG